MKLSTGERQRGAGPAAKRAQAKGKSIARKTILLISLIMEFVLPN
jgi:hypothetical protein